MSKRLTGISSMATRALLADLAQAYGRRGGAVVAFESVGGVEAAKRVRAGEAFDLVVLAAEAIEALVGSGDVLAAGLTAVVRSAVAVAVRQGAQRPDIDTSDALRQAVQAARGIGYSTGPSGTALVALLRRWGLLEALQDRLVQAPPGVPVGALLARGEVELGFQQLSELMHLQGIDVLGTMPPGTEIVTTFSAARCSASSQPREVDALLAFMASAETADIKRRHGMHPA